MTAKQRGLCVFFGCSSHERGGGLELEGKMEGNKALPRDSVPYFGLSLKLITS